VYGAKAKNLAGRAYLVRRLMDKQHLSRRQATAVVNTILERMIRALKLGREVQFPFGNLRRVKRHFSQYWDGVDDWPANRSPYTVEWQLDEAGDQELNGWRRPKKGRSRIKSVDE